VTGFVTRKVGKNVHNPTHNFLFEKVAQKQKQKQKQGPRVSFSSKVTNRSKGEIFAQSGYPGLK
jgi:hypothetical protein